MNRVVELLESMRQENAVLKDHQDMLFKKQDIIQYTLAGDIKEPTSQIPSSLSAPSVLAWCPVPNSPPFVSPKVQPVEQQFPGELYFPQYATPFQQSFDSHSAYSLDDVHSFINKKWEGTGGDSGIAGEGNPPLESEESSAEFDQISSVEGVDSTPAPLAGNPLATTPPLPPAGKPAAVTPLLQAGKPTAATPLLPAGKPAAAPPLLPAGNPSRYSTHRIEWIFTSSMEGTNRL